ncbi:hypothetical protein L1276_002079 [Flavobacterium sp. HSC-32F16]|uniref:hypothetical protein n=1 Tax=Flavobacterium sp. HSC-32F16 TaxID=2910964 RepID=UPI0020A31DDD|nr:hypothetical protein [Flavobacterium sp. HSC-32F16]MCP2026935.1 hypothetical protein [Flavobacterium sp. HSC-32F16]
MKKEINFGNKNLQVNQKIMFRKNNYNDSNYDYYNSRKGISTLSKIICFFLPIIGFLVYASKRNKEPEAAKSAGEMAIAGFFFGIFLRLFWYAYTIR